MCERMYFRVIAQILKAYFEKNKKFIDIHLSSFSLMHSKHLKFTIVVLYCPLLLITVFRIMFYLAYVILIINH